MVNSRIHAALLLSGALAVNLAVPLAAANAEQVTLTATLTGANEPAGGDPKGSGTFEVKIDPEAGDFCYTLTAIGIAKATMAHVHTGAAGVNGPPAATLEVTGAGNDECIALDPDVLKPIIATPANYYVNVHNATYPAGAIRGQLQIR
jgi:hypothetical protein